MYHPVLCPQASASLEITCAHLQQAFILLTHLQESPFLLHEFVLSMNSQMLAPCHFSLLVLTPLSNIKQFDVFFLSYKPLCLFSSLTFKGNP